MKKLSVLIVIVALLFSFAPTALAVSGTFDLDELGLQITIPSGYSVITKDTPAGDPIFSVLGTTKSALMSDFKAKNIYLNAGSDTYSEEIVVTNTKVSTSNFSLLSDTALNTLATTLLDEFDDYGIYVSDYEIYQHSQAKFIKVYFTDAAKSVHGLQYYTVYEGNAMNFTMRSYEGSLSYRQETTIKTIVDSIKYDNDPPLSEEGEDTDSFVYTDTDSGAKFTVPANWKKKEFFEDREYIDVKFVSTKDDGCVIIYASEDIWEEMSPADRIGYTRSDVNNDIFTRADVAEMFSTTADKVSTVTYNGVEYFQGEIDHTSDDYGGLTVRMTALVCIDNGWLHMFQFGGTSTHKLYSEFESLMDSVVYSDTLSETGIGSFDNDTYDTDYEDDGADAIVVIVFMLVIGGIVAIGVVTRKKRNKTEVQAEVAQSDEPTEAEQTVDAEPTVYCKNCGQALPLDSKFCHICGTEVEKE